MHVGAAPDWFMDDFDAEIKAMRKAVKAALGCRETIKQLKLELRREKRNAVKDNRMGTSV
jgi:translation initiation factor 1 (eIF-1/SUI1)